MGHASSSSLQRSDVNDKLKRAEQRRKEEEERRRLDLEAKQKVKDDRTKAAAKQLQQQIPKVEVSRVTGNTQLAPDPTASSFKFSTVPASSYTMPSHGDAVQEASRGANQKTGAIAPLQLRNANVPPQETQNNMVSKDSKAVAGAALATTPRLAGSTVPVLLTNTSLKTGATLAHKSTSQMPPMTPAELVRVKSSFGWSKACQCLIYML